ncbi:glycosyltransferase [Carboxylicivirga linearis]|uniref:Glycosyl transferase family 28 C-terminal domain-containing protein n=1 Tax=Carboxylicivirga linearis TaxID=1628157 RepID=A0ABS5K2J2_9BACT|nr:glycosyltransferase [Carboxylicivirga linearis]MBS2100899.1 hypothetical protein [Carboxylicivirga linearis]
MKLKAPQFKHILISPLNWGLGHASRLIPIINELLKEGHQCYIAGEQPSISVIQQAFPKLTYIILENLSIQLSNSNHQLLKLASQLPQFIQSIKRDKKIVKNLVNELDLDCIISDNRYGFRHDFIPSVLLTHQTNIMTGKLLNWSKPIVQFFLKQWINQFDACWIPDIDTQPTISGKLSSKILHPNTFRIGITSRLSIVQHEAKVSKELQNPDVLIILSGPEPQRSILEDLIVKRYINRQLRVVVLRAQPNKKKLIKNGSITFLPHCNSSSYLHLLNNSKQIVCRSGYSTLMDLAYVNRQAILIPTPGQYEQEYLAEHMRKNFHFVTVNQREIPSSPLLSFHADSNQRSFFQVPKNFHLPPLPLKK